MSLPQESLGDAIAELSAHLNAARSRLVDLIAEFDAAGGWADEGCLSCAHWLNWRCGVSPPAAREQVRVARALAALPRTHAAFAAGRLSYSKVRALTRVATPANEAYLLMLAEHGTAAHLEKVVGAVRRERAVRDLEQANARHEARSLEWWFDDDGMLILRARLDPEQGARFVAAVERELAVVRRGRDACAPLEARGDAEPATTTHGAMRADALLRLVEGDCPDTTITVHVSAPALAGDAPEGCCELEHGPALAPESARRLACDAGVVRLLEGEDGEPLAVGRRTRAIAPAIRRALVARDRGCRFPGCDATSRVEGHHVRHWARGGETSLANLVSLCRHHHRLVHEGGFAVRAIGPGRFRFQRPDGRAIEAVTPPRAVAGCPAGRLRAANQALGLRIDEETGTTLWDGVPMDTALAVEGVLAAGGELEM
jgi:hypothetical protein